MADRAFLQHFDANDLVMSATAYYLGRQTASVHSHCERLIKAWPQLDKHVRDYIERIVEREFCRFGALEAQTDESGCIRTGSGFVMPLGHKCDREMWLKVRQLWKAKE